MLLALGTMMVTAGLLRAVAALASGERSWWRAWWLWAGAGLLGTAQLPL